MPRARLIHFQLWKYPRIHDLSLEGRVLLIDIYSSVDDDGIVEVYPIQKIEGFDKALLYELKGAGLIDILDETNMIVFAEDHYLLNTFFKTKKYHPSKYRTLLFQKRPDIENYFFEHFGKEMKEISETKMHTDDQVLLLSDTEEFTDYNYILKVCESVDISEHIAKVCLHELSKYPEAVLTDELRFEIIKQIDIRTRNKKGDIYNYEQYVKAAVFNELKEKDLII